MNETVYNRLKSELSTYSDGLEISLLPVLFDKIVLKEDYDTGVNMRLLCSKLFADPEVEVCFYGGLVNGKYQRSQIIVGTRRDPYLKSICRHTADYDLVDYLGRERSRQERLEPGQFVKEGDEL